MGIDFSATRRRVFAMAHPRKLGGGALLTAPNLAHEYDLTRLGHVELSATRTLTATRAGVAHGLLLWFELELSGGWLGTGPLAPPSAWQQTIFPLSRPLPVAAGAQLHVELQAAAAGEGLSWRWSLQNP